MMESIKFTEGLVRQAGYEDDKCKFTRLEDGKTLYLIEDVEIGNNMYVVTPNVSEAIKRAERNTIGIINDNGNIEVPMVNCDVISINDTYVAVGTKKEKESNPEDIQKIKEKIERNLSSGIDFIIIDDKIEYDVYKVEDGKLNLVFENASIVLENDGSLFVHTDNKDDELVTIFEKENKETNTIDEQRPQMPVENFAKVNEKMVDSLQISDMEEQKEGAPELKEEAVDNEIETVNEIKPVEENKSEHFSFSDINTINPEISQIEIEKESEVEEKEESNPELEMTNYDNRLEMSDYDDRLEIENQMADITSLINAGRDKVKELSYERESYKKEIEDLKAKISTLEKENNEINDTVLKQKGLIDELNGVKAKLVDKNQRLINENKKLSSENHELLSENESLKKNVSSLEESMKDVYGAIYDAFSDIREPEKEYRKVA